MSIYIITGVVSLLAVLGLLFYWLKKRKKSNHSTKYGGDMAEYGVQVARDNGQLVNLTDRPVMVMDVINVQYGVNGSRNFHTPVSCVGIDIDHDVDPASDGKTISVKHVGNSVTWTWHPAKELKPTNAKIIVFSGG